MWWPQTIALSLPLLTDSFLVLCSASVRVTTGSMRRYLQPNQVAQVNQLLRDGTSVKVVARRFAVWNPQSDCQTWALSSSWCRTMPGLMWTNFVGSSGMMKALMHWLALLFPDLNPVEDLWHMWYVSVNLMPPNTATDCPWADWCPDPGQGGDPPGHHPRLIRRMPRCFRECILTLEGHTHCWVAVLKWIRL